MRRSKFAALHAGRCSSPALPVTPACRWPRSRWGSRCTARPGPPALRRGSAARGRTAGSSVNRPARQVNRRKDPTAAPEPGAAAGVRAEGQATGRLGGHDGHRTETRSKQRTLHAAQGHAGRGRSDDWDGSCSAPRGRPRPGLRRHRRRPGSGGQVGRVARAAAVAAAGRVGLRSRAREPSRRAVRRDPRPTPRSARTSNVSEGRRPGTHRQTPSSCCQRSAMPCWIFSSARGPAGPIPGARLAPISPSRLAGSPDPTSIRTRSDRRFDGTDQGRLGHQGPGPGGASR